MEPRRRKYDHGIHGIIKAVVISILSAFIIGTVVWGLGVNDHITEISVTVSNLESRALERNKDVNDRLDKIDAKLDRVIDRLIDQKSNTTPGR